MGFKVNSRKVQDFEQKNFFQFFADNFFSFVPKTKSDSDFHFRKKLFYFFETFEPF